MLEAGKLLQNRYRIEKQIGQGGMGAVYVAKDERFKSTVAIKETLFSDEIYRKAFDREARLLNSLRHPALPNVTDYFDEGNGQFLVMEYIAGEDLYETLERTGKHFPLDDVLIWANQLLDALDYLHNQKMPIIHRDIKPQNLKLTPANQIILLDFGLAKGNPADLTNHTAAKSIFGYSPGYASLEQIQGTGTEPRSDLYSLAATLYHLMTGVPPADALTRAMSVLNETADPFQPAHLVRKEIPAGISEILRRAMALNANQRPVSALEMRGMLENQESITILDNASSLGENLPKADIHSRKTEIIPGTATAKRQSDLKTEVYKNSAPQSDVSRVTKFASLDKGKTGTGKIKNRYAIAGAVFGLLLLFGAGIFSLNLNQSDKSEAPGKRFEPVNTVQTAVSEKDDQDARSEKKNAVNTLEKQEVTVAENPIPIESKKPVKTIEKDKNEAQAKKPADNQVTVNEPETDDEEFNLGNVRIKGDRVETDEFIVEDDKITFKNKPRPQNRRTPPPLTPEQLRSMPPEQREKLRRAVEIQNRVLIRRPPKPPPPKPEN